MSIYEICGIIGTILLVYCGAPQAYTSWKQKHSEGINWYFIVSWFVGELFYSVYVISIEDWIIACNIFANIIFAGIIVWYKLFPTKEGVREQEI